MIEKKMLYAIIAVVAVVAVAGAAAFVVLSKDKTPEYSVTLTGDDSISFTYKVSDGDAKEYTAPFKVKKGTEITVTAAVKTGYAFKAWDDGSKDAVKKAKIDGNTEWKATSENLVLKIADAIMTYSGVYGNDEGKFTKDASSTDTLVKLNGQTHVGKYTKTYYILVGASDNPTVTLTEKKNASDYDQYSPANKYYSMSIVADTGFDYYDAYYGNSSMKGGSSCFYFGLQAGSVYVSGYGDIDPLPGAEKTSGGVREYKGEGATLSDASNLLSIIAKAAGVEYTLKEKNTIQQFVVDHYSGDFGVYSVDQNGNLISTKGQDTFGPMVFKICSDEAQAKQVYDAACGFTFDDVLTPPSQKALTEWGYGEITQAEVPESTSKVYTKTIEDFDGFHGFYVTKKMGDSNSTRMCFVAYVDNVYISSVHRDNPPIDDTGSNYQYINGEGSHIDNTNLGTLFVAIQNAIASVNGGIPVD